ncbi:PKD domain-containing protein [Mucilaginibacter segetis]|uniref:PKD domain-containing protein n=1 Tax=Mucilaginibacter segetis TaxID=2793071 RepID=A0A934PTS0_9SPHI|nr:PKD domain-containing protein [Mucilaginibacter segetis]MBK0379407.1 PKD domain-containing protein [Mucilaginibacter segetis]
MNKNKAAISATVIFLFIFSSYYSFAQNTSNQGKEFWTGYMSHIESTGQSQMNLYITGDVNTSGTVEIADGSFDPIPFTVTAKQVTKIAIPRIAFVKSSGQFLKGLHITAQKKVAVYAHIYASSVSGATLLLPVNVLGKSYYSLNYTQKANESPTYSTFMVIATEDNTVVEIVPSAPLIGKTGKFTVTLKKGELYQGLSSGDLTGTKIRSISTSDGQCKKIAVFSGSTKIGIGCDEGSFTSDNLIQQAYPTSSWGKNFITVPLKNRNYDVFRIFFSEPDTKLTINGALQTQEEGPPYIEFNSQIPNIISADKPIQIIQYAVSQEKSLGDNCNGNPNDVGDPEMIYLNPIEQTLDHVTLYSASESAISQSYINVVTKSSNVKTFKLDGKSYDKFTPLQGDTSYSYAQINVQNGTHNINASDGFNAIAYGFGYAESYGYSAGTNVKNLNESIVFENQQTNKIQENGCVGVSYKLKLTLPYQTGRITWKNIDGDNTSYIDNNPTVKSTTQKDNKTLYTYEYYKPVTFLAGDYSITATVLNPVADECGSDEDIDFDFNIADYPAPVISVSDNCNGDTTYFADSTSNESSIIKTWLWDFGDGQTSTLQNPRHYYTNPGIYNVILTVGNENECYSTSAPVAVHIIKKPAAAFNLSIPACVNKDVIISDKSTSEESNIIKWVWDYGDGTEIETRTSSTPFTHVFTTTGIDTVTLTIFTDKGCVDSSKRVININPQPVIDFTVPDICLTDAVAQFTDKSTIEDGSNNSFTYQWDFGDNNATPQNSNTSTSKNPKHIYTRADNYTVTLTLITSSGCSYSKSQIFTVNGDTPAAKFTIEDKDNLCSGNPVIIDDQSTVNFGNITKIIWYYDYSDNPQNFETFNRADMPANRKYTHDYGVFNSPQTKTYTIRMEAYSGESCVNITQQDIVVKANPLVFITQLGFICQSASPVQIQVDKNGFIGNGIFSGKGVSADGLFDPYIAGPGVFTINYDFTAQNGCSYTTSEEITVNPDPVIDAGEDLTILEGNSVILKASASGNGVSYKWTPSTGLNRDDILQPTASPIFDTNYTLTVTTANSCTKTDNIFVKVLKDLTVINTFTPNGDGINDKWNIPYLDNYPGSTVKIYNRYGETVYSSIGYSDPWDGTFNGRILPAGTYYYIIDPKNGRKVISGNVTIIR